MDTQQISRMLYRIVRLTFHHLTKYQQKAMTDIIVGLIYAKSFTLREIASKIPGETNVKHKLKRLQNFLDKLLLDKDFWQSYVKTIFFLPYFRLKRRKYISVIIDFTTLKDNFLVLCASISFRQRSIPIYTQMWKGVNVTYDYWGRVEKFLKGLKSILPEHKYVLLFDRGFGSYRIFEILKKLKWNYVVRINDSYCAIKKDGTGYIQLSLFEGGYYELKVLGKNHPVEDIKLVINELRSEDGSMAKWYLATSLSEKEESVNVYTERMWIEESIKDLKQILNWERYTKKLPLKDRLEKLIVLSGLSYAIQVCIGTQVKIPPSEEKKTSIIKRFQHIMTEINRKVVPILSIILTLFCVYICRSS